MSIGRIVLQMVVVLCVPMYAALAGTDVPTVEQFELSPEEIEIANNIMDKPEDQEVVRFENFMLEMGWDESGQEHRKEIYQQISELKQALQQNMQELKDNAEDMKKNEQSLANRTLTAVTTAATGLGGMELARGLSEQRADKIAEQDMSAYIKTFRCEYGKGKSFKASPDKIELPGGNNANIMKYRNEYFSLVADLKERKTALGMKPGIESEEILDKSQTGLYDDESEGITDAQYASLYRAQMLASEKDKEQLDKEAEKSNKRVKIGGVVAAAGAVVGVVGNQILNHDKHDKSAEILAKREEINQQLADVVDFELDECNAKIQAAKKWAQQQKNTSGYKKNSGLRNYIAEIEKLEFLTEQNDVFKLMDHPICY